MKFSLPLAACFFAAVSVNAAEPLGEPFIYKKVNEQELKLYLFKPADWRSTDKRPAIVFFHGGGWVGGTPALLDEQCKYFASRGMICASVQYRLLEKPKKEPPLICIQDAKSAMRWVRSHARDLAIDPNRIASGGGSAGGHLAAFVGIVEGCDDPQDDLSISPKAQAMILFNPVFNNGPENYGYEHIGERYKEFSPAHNITRDDPPATIFLGSEDHLIPVKTVKDFQADMQKLGIRCDAHIYEGQKHGFYGSANPKYFYQTVTETDKFLASLGWIKGPPTLKEPPPATPKKATSPKTKPPNN